MHAITPLLSTGAVLAMLGRDRGARYSRAFARQSTDWCLPVTCHIVPRNGLDRHRSQRRFAHRVRHTAQNKHTLMATWAWPPMFSTACTAPTQKSRHTCSLQPGSLPASSWRMNVALIKVSGVPLWPSSPRLSSPARGGKARGATSRDSNESGASWQPPAFAAAPVHRCCKLASSGRLRSCELFFASCAPCGS